MCSPTILQLPGQHARTLLRPPFRKELATKLQGALLGDSFQGQCLQDLPASLWDRGLPGQPSANDWAQWGLGPDRSHPGEDSSHSHLGSRSPHCVDQALSGLSCSLWSPCPILLSPPFSFQGVRSESPSRGFPCPALFPFSLFFTDLPPTKNNPTVLLIPATVCFPSSPTPHHT